MFTLDETDKKIIEVLKNDSRTPFTEIASRLGVSDSTIHVRLRKLREEGIIKAYTIEVNEEVYGKKVFGLAMINANLGYLDKVVPELVALENVVNVYETHGSNDLIAFIDAMNLDELRDILMEIRMMENVASTSLTTILKIWK